MSPTRFVVSAVLVLVCGCGSMSAPTRDGKPDRGSVSGVVVDSAGQRVRGAIVTVLAAGMLPEELGSANSNSRGEFTVEQLPPGRDRIVRIVKPGRAVNPQATKDGVTVRGGKVTDLGEIELMAN